MDNAQSTDGSPGANNSTDQEDGQPVVQPTDQNGAQARINELVARTKAAEQRADDAQRAAQEAMALAARSIPQAVAPQGPAPLSIEIPEGMDPAQAQFFKQLTAGFQAQLQAQSKATQEALAQVGRQSQQQMANMQLQGMLAQEAPEVQKMAADLLADWQRRGLQGFEAKDAIIYARGSLGAPAPGRRGPPPPNGEADDHLTPGASGVPQSRGVSIQAALPDDVIAKMPLAKQEAYWAKRVAAQSGNKLDVPIIYD